MQIIFVSFEVQIYVNGFENMAQVANANGIILNKKCTLALAIL